MRPQKIIYFSRSIAAFLIAVFAMGSINQTIVAQEKSNSNEPTVVRTSPADGEEDVARNAVIEITFSEEMDSTAMYHSTFTLMQANEAVSGTMAYSGNKGTFTTAKSLMAETVYTANITIVTNGTDEVHSDDGINDEDTEENYSSGNGNEWSFTTGGNSDPVETVDLGSAAAYVILAQSYTDIDSISDITGEKGFDPDFERTSIDDNQTAYWVNNDDIEKNVVGQDTTRKTNENRDYSASEINSDTTNSDNLDKAFEDMMAAYTNASERSHVDFVDYKFVQSNKKADSTLDDQSADDHDMNSTDAMDSTDVEFEKDYNTESTTTLNTTDSSMTLEPGIYTWNESVEITSDIKLKGNSNDVWIFQVPEGLLVNSDVEITLSGGAVTKHVFWQVAGDVTIGTDAHFEGIILSEEGISMEDGATMNGRMLTQSDVSLNNNTVTQPNMITTVQRTTSSEE
jgi:hypothetical protein